MEEGCIDSTNSIEDKIELSVGMRFDNLDELWECFQKVGVQCGFPTRKRTTRKNDDGVVKSVTYWCAKGGKPPNTGTNPLKRKGSQRTGCPARLGARLDSSGKWIISVLVLEHNHLLLSPSATRFLSCNRFVNSHTKRRLILLDESGVRLHKGYTTLVHEAGGYENMTCSQKDCRNYMAEVRRSQLKDGDAAAIWKHFTQRFAEDKGFYFDVQLDTDGSLRHVFWADGRSREAYKEFGEVLTFDTTYLTNKYDMPFAPFVGVNHHGHSILFGCALLSGETIESFEWLFTTWLKCMGGVAPKGIVTDQDKAMQSAIRTVFPNTRHRWCLWHVMKKVPEKLGKYTDSQKIITTVKFLIYDSQYTSDFEDDWDHMLELYSSLKECEWLNGLYENREMWIPCYCNGMFWAGMSSTQRSEGMNAFFDDYVGSKTTLKQFVDQYDNALRDKVEKELQADVDSMIREIPTVTFFEMEKQIQKVYTNEKFREFQEELVAKMYCDLLEMDTTTPVKKFVIREVKWLEDGLKKIMQFDVLFDEITQLSCSCRMFEFKGIVCRHSLYVLARYNVESLPDQFILKRWCKNIRRSHTKMKLHFNTSQNSIEQRRYRELCVLFSEIADFVAPHKEKYIDMKEALVGYMNALKIKDIAPTVQDENLEENESDEEGESESESETIPPRDPKKKTPRGRPRILRIKRLKKRNANEKEAGTTTEVAEPKETLESMIQRLGLYGQSLDSHIRSSRKSKQ